MSLFFIWMLVRVALILPQKHANVHFPTFLLSYFLTTNKTVDAPAWAVMVLLCIADIKY